MANDPFTNVRVFDDSGEHLPAGADMALAPRRPHAAFDNRLFHREPPPRSAHRLNFSAA